MLEKDIRILTNIWRNESESVSYKNDWINFKKVL